MNQTTRIVVFTLADQTLAVPLAAVERVVYAVETASVAEAPEMVVGVVNVEGRILPVIDIRRRFGQAARERELTDQFMIVKTPTRTVALVADTVRGFVEYTAEEEVKSEQIFPGLGFIDGVVKRRGEMILICDLERLLSAEAECRLDAALEE